MLVGMKIDINPIPHIPENTQMFPAGAICFGVEYRVLNEQIVGDEYKGDMGRIRELQKEIASEKIDEPSSTVVTATSGCARCNEVKNSAMPSTIAPTSSPRSTAPAT